MCRNNKYSKWCQAKSSGFLTLGKSTRECTSPYVDDDNEEEAREYCERWTQAQNEEAMRRFAEDYWRS